MRIKHKPRIKIGTIRIIRKFLFLPICIGWEERWLEFACIQQVREEGSSYAEIPDRWVNVCWSSEIEKALYENSQK